MNWWNNACAICLTVRKVMLDAAKLMLSLLLIVSTIFSGLFLYWIMFDISPVMQYGPNGRKEFVEDRIIFYLDATRLRNCDTKIYRKITGCGQVDLPVTFATTPVGSQAPPISVPLSTLFQSFTREQLSGSICSLISQAESYCNPAQRLLRLPIVVQSPPISFIPVPRSQSYQRPPLP